MDHASLPRLYPVRLSRDEPAAVLYGALAASATAAPVFGADDEVIGFAKAAAAR